MTINYTFLENHDKFAFEFSRVNSIFTTGPFFRQDIRIGARFFKKITK